MPKTLQKRITLLGGGGGPAAILPGLVETLPSSTAVTVVTGTHDSGNSTGKLRQLFNTVAVGDVRKNLSAASDTSAGALFETRFGPSATSHDVALLNDMFLQRVQPFMVADVQRVLKQVLVMSERLERLSEHDQGQLRGHTYGNLVLIALCLLHNASIAKAARIAGDWLGVRANVLPVTEQVHDLVMQYGTKTIVGEGIIDDMVLSDPLQARLWLEPIPKVSNAALQSIADASVIVLGPGSLFTSLLPLLYVDGVADAIRTQHRNGGIFVFLANIAIEALTPTLEIADHVTLIEQCVGRPFDHVVYNTAALPQDVVASKLDAARCSGTTTYIGADLIDVRPVVADPNDDIAHLRSLVYHDGVKLAHVLTTHIL